MWARCVRAREEGGGVGTNSQKLDVLRRLQSPFYPSRDSREGTLPGSVSCCGCTSQVLVLPASSIGASRPCRQQIAENGYSSGGLGAFSCPGPQPQHKEGSWEKGEQRPSPGQTQAAPELHAKIINWSRHSLLSALLYSI